MPKVTMGDYEIEYAEKRKDQGVYQAQADRQPQGAFRGLFRRQCDDSAQGFGFSG